jgi:pyruvate ferredoxin oxidoreductase alpha subunit
VICAYPITPQTHIVAELAKMVADGQLKAEYVNAESEHSAASIVLGATATGVRTFTSTSSQGLLLMAEVLFNIAGMRLPVVLACVNRAISAPLSIWNDQQDSLSLRDSGVIQLYAENNQEAADLMYLAYRVAEDRRVLLPAMVCLDGYLLSHAWEAVEMPAPEVVDAFLPPYNPLYKLDPEAPLTMGMYANPDLYMEARWALQQAMEEAIAVIQEASHDFERVFGRPMAGILEEYRTEDATTILVCMGSLVSVAKEVVDELRGRGKKVGVVKLVSYRPFPKVLLREALKGASSILVLEKGISLGSAGPVLLDVRSALHGRPRQPKIRGFVVGLGGRDVTRETIKAALAEKELVDARFLDLKAEVALASAEEATGRDSKPPAGVGRGTAHA